MNNMEPCGLYSYSIISFGGLDHAELPAITGGHEYYPLLFREDGSRFAMSADHECDGQIIETGGVRRWHPGGNSIKAANG